VSGRATHTCSHKMPTMTAMATVCTKFKVDRITPSCWRPLRPRSHASDKERVGRAALVYACVCLCWCECICLSQCKDGADLRRKRTESWVRHVASQRWPSWRTPSTGTFLDASVGSTPAAGTEAADDDHEEAEDDEGVSA
jgi:hypothetical protein